MTPKTPKTLEGATALCERHAALSATVSDAEAVRQGELARVNAAADAELVPIINELDAISEALRLWWPKGGRALTGDKRKSVELGGCKIGTRADPEKIAFDGDEKAQLAAVETAKLNGVATTVKRVIDRSGILALLKKDGATAAKLRAAGFTIVGGGETFFIKRADSADAKISATR